MESKEALEQYVQTEKGSKDQNAWYKLGNIYRKEENWEKHSMPMPNAWNWVHTMQPERLLNLSNAS